jgi:hypothetical protein
VISSQAQRKGGGWKRDKNVAFDTTWFSAASVEGLDRYRPRASERTGWRVPESRVRDGVGNLDCETEKQDRGVSDVGEMYWEPFFSLYVLKSRRDVLEIVGYLCYTRPSFG